MKNFVGFWGESKSKIYGPLGPCKFGLIFMGMKQVFLFCFLKKKIKIAGNEWSETA